MDLDSLELGSDFASCDIGGGEDGSGHGDSIRRGHEALGNEDPDPGAEFQPE